MCPQPLQPRLQEHDAGVDALGAAALVCQLGGDLLPAAALLTDKRVGYTRESGIEDKTLNTAWSKSDQNTAFYGTFSLNAAR